MFAALEVATGKVTDAPFDGHRHEEFLPSSSWWPRLRSVNELKSAIEVYIDGGTNAAKPFVWTKTAEQILNHSRSQKDFIHATLESVNPPRVLS